MLQRLAVLAAEGFVTHVSPAGPEGGVDALAGQGGRGFDGARLAVQVKSGRIVVDAGTLRELHGMMANFGASRGLMVSWGGVPQDRPGRGAALVLSTSPLGRRRRDREGAGDLRPSVTGTADRTAAEAEEIAAIHGRHDARGH